MKTLDRFLQRWRIRRAGRYLKPRDRVLDIGCADGALFRQLEHLTQGVGIEPGLQERRELPNAILCPGLFPEALPDNEPFDAITLLAVLEHIRPEQQDILAAGCAAALKPGGLVVITVPSAAVDAILVVLKKMRLIDGMALEEHYGFDVREIPQIFGRYGFKLVEHRRFQLGLNNLFLLRSPAGDA